MVIIVVVVVAVAVAVGGGGVVIDGRGGLRVVSCGCGCLFRTRAPDIISCLNYHSHLCPVSSTGYRIVGQSSTGSGFDSC